MTACWTCTHGQLRDPTRPERDRTLKGMASSGFVNCAMSPFRASFMPLTSTCGSFRPGDPDTVSARQAWAAKNQKASS